MIPEDLIEIKMIPEDFRRITYNKNKTIFKTKSIEKDSTVKRKKIKVKLAQFKI